MSVIFNLEKEFEIGDLKIKAYQYDHVTLFDPKYLIELVGREFINNEKLNKQRIMDRINPDFIIKVDVREGGDNAPLHTGKKLLSPEGVYQLLFFLDNETANRICKTFVGLLESYRKDRGLTIDKFLKGAYKNSIEYLPGKLDGSYNLSEKLRNILLTISEGDLYVLESFTFPVINDLPITTLNYNIDSSDKIKIGMKLDFYINCEKCIEAISKLENKDMVTTLTFFVSKHLRAYNIEPCFFRAEENMEKAMYFEGLELFKALRDMNYGNYVFTVKLFNTIMKLIYQDEYLANVLTNSVTKYHFISRNIPTKEIKDYFSNIENLYE